MRTDKRYCIDYSITLPANAIIRIKARMPKTINLKKNVNRNLLLTVNYDSASERQTAGAGLFWPWARCTSDVWVFQQRRKIVCSE